MGQCPHNLNEFIFSLMFKLNTRKYDSQEQLTQAVLQVADMLGMYRTELARVLQLQCGDIGKLSAVKQFLQPGTKAWHQATMFIRFYQVLYEAHMGDEIAIYKWLHRSNKAFEGVPLLLIVDEGRITDVLEHLEKSALTNQNVPQI